MFEYLYYTSINDEFLSPLMNEVIIFISTILNSQSITIDLSYQMMF